MFAFCCTCKFCSYCFKLTCVGGLLVWLGVVVIAVVSCLVFSLDLLFGCYTLVVYLLLGLGLVLSCFVWFGL